MLCAIDWAYGCCDEARVSSGDRGARAQHGVRRDRPESERRQRRHRRRRDRRAARYEPSRWTRPRRRRSGMTPTRPAAATASSIRRSARRATTATCARATAAPPTATIEKDYDCPTPGKPCVYLVKCGDGVLGGIEQCDPPERRARLLGGLQARARLRVRRRRPRSPIRRRRRPATRPFAGTARKEGTEACDDGNIVDGDGCSSSCTLEPDCSSGTCASASAATA